MTKPAGKNSQAGVSAADAKNAIDSGTPNGETPHGARAPDGRDDYHSGDAAGTQLMNAPSSPGRTWSTLDPHRWLRALAAAVSATVRLARRRGTGVPGLA